MTSGPDWYPAPDPDGLTERVTRAFGAAFDAAPAGVWAAPGRVNLIGEHVDYNRGLCLPFALGQRTFVAVRPRDDARVRVRSEQRPDAWDGLLDDIRPGLSPGWVGYVAGVLFALRSAGFDVPGLDVLVDSEVPAGSGLSSSAALECAVAVAVDELAGTGLGEDDGGRARLAALCVRAENEIAGAPTGGMDQAAALRSREAHAFVLDCQAFSVEHVPLDLAGAGLALLVIDTRAHHSLIDGQYGSRRDVCDEAARLLGVESLRDIQPGALDGALAHLPHAQQRRLVRHVVTEIERVREAAGLLRAGRLAELGPLLDASHRSLRDDYQVSCEELDLACDVARGSGALGARMTGGGFGGSAIALLPAAAAGSVAAAVDETFVTAGLTRPAFLLAAAGGSASRVR